MMLNTLRSERQFDTERAKLTLMDCSRLMIFFADKESAFECSAVQSS